MLGSSGIIYHKEHKTTNKEIKMGQMMIKYPFNLVTISEMYWKNENFLMLVLFSMATLANIMLFLATITAPFFILKGML